jgi:phosphoribosyl 1,2-cyclic phosphodiesterase
MRVVVLASGSKGNATLFAGRRGTRILVDAGISLRAFKQQLERLQEPTTLDAIVITHAHSDHVGHCERLAAKLNVPLYMSEATARATWIDGVRKFSPREPFQIGDLLITPTPLPHDAAQVALTLHDGMHKVALCTDLGEVPPALPAVLSGADLLLIESNHDLQMLRDGPYPMSIKRRIASAGGHLSNAQTAELLRAIGPSLREVVLMHLSETNNRADLALATAKDALSGCGVSVRLATQSTPLLLAPQERLLQRRASAPVRVDQLAFAF